ncbi:hypothetical protein GCM10027432_28390 [Lysobacter fragariae]
MADVLMTGVDPGRCASVHHSPSKDKSAFIRLATTVPDTTGLPYGLTGVDAKSFDSPDRIGIYVPAGRRTIWYSCPNTPATNDSPHLTYDFAADGGYELVCATGTESYIHQLP